MKSRVARVLFLWTAAVMIVTLPGCQAQPPQASGVPAPAAPPAPPSPLPPTPALAAPAVPDPDYWPTAGWKSSTPEQQGMDSAKLAAAFDAIDQRGLNLHSVLIIRNGYLVAEAYFTPYGPDVKQQLASVTKSVSGMLTGIAMYQGGIQSTSEKVLSFFPDRKIANLDENKRKMTLEDLLTQTTGLNCLDENGDLNRMFQSRDWVQFTLDLPMVDAPGKQLRYCSPAVHLFSPILEQATGKSERGLANESLFAPLGIQSADRADWEVDPQGSPEGFSGLRLVPRDMAKLGFLYLHRGKWNGQQVVPASWVRASLTPHTVEAKSGRPYGYLIWLYPQGYQSMMGLGGQDIHIIPAKNMVVVFTAAMDIPTHDKEMIKLIDEFIVPAAASDKPLPESAAAAAQLQARIARAAAPQVPVPALPALARSISGKVYAMGDNPSGWRTISLSFEEGSAEATVTVNGSQKLPIGLDNVYRKTQGPGSAVVALRGHWEGEDTFVVEDNNVGTYLQWQYRITFPGDRMQIEGKELVNRTEGTVTGHLAP